MKRYPESKDCFIRSSTRASLADTKELTVKSYGLYRPSNLCFGGLASRLKLHNVSCPMLRRWLKAMLLSSSIFSCTLFISCIPLLTARGEPMTALNDVEFRSFVDIV